MVTVDQLLYTTDQDRTFVTHNRADYFLLHDAWHQWSQAWGVPAPRHASILALDQDLIAAVAQAIQDLLLRTPQVARGDLVFRWHTGTNTWEPYP